MTDLKLEEGEELYIFFRGRRYKGYIKNLSISRNAGEFERIDLDVFGIFMDKGWL